jgi:hypothetical protein
VTELARISGFQDFTGPTRCAIPGPGRGDSEWQLSGRTDVPCALKTSLMQGLGKATVGQKRKYRGNEKGDLEIAKRGRSYFIIF